MTKYLKESNIHKMLEEHVRKVSDGLYADMAQSPGHDIEENPEKRAPWAGLTGLVFYDNCLYCSGLEGGNFKKLPDCGIIMEFP